MLYFHFTQTVSAFILLVKVIVAVTYLIWMYLLKKYSALILSELHNGF